MSTKLNIFFDLIKYVFLTLLILSGVEIMRAQNNVSSFIVTGQVIDSLTRKSLPYVSVTDINNNDIVLTDAKGKFRLLNINPQDTLLFKIMGYGEKLMSVNSFVPGKTIKVTLFPESTELAEVIVTKNKKPKYSKKNNPAVDLMQRIRASYAQIDPRRQPYYSYDQHEKILLALNDFHKEKSPWLAKRLDPIEQYIDTVPSTGLPVLNLSFREKISTHLNSSTPKIHKEVIKGVRNGGIDNSFDQDNIRIMLEDVFREIDIYSNDIVILQNRFVSPLSSIAADYYKYYLGDTITENGNRYVELIFVPHNPQSFSFNGSMYVDIDSPVPFINRVTMRIPKAINLNFVKNIFIDQKFARDYMGNRHKLSDDMSVEFQLVNGLQGFYANRHIDAGNFTYDRLPDYSEYFDMSESVIITPSADTRPESFWQAHGLSEVSDVEKSVMSLSDRLDKISLFKWTRRIVKLLVTGYVPTGNPSKVDIGPVNTLISANSIEGARFRLGGMTTAALSPHWFARGYGAYGTKDHRWKYGAEIEYSFLKKKKHSREFPMHSFRLEHNYDLDMIGQHYLFTNPDNVFLSLKRMENHLGTYRLLTRFSYNYEHVCGLTLQLGIKTERQTATSYLPFITPEGVNWNHYRTSALFLDVQYAPGAKFVQTASNRLPVNMDNWNFRLSHEYGPKRLFGSDFVINKTEVSVQKRFWFSAFGYLDALVKGGKVWSSVPYPALPWPNANLSYTIQPESYSLMNPMEFAIDSYASWDLTYWMNGLIFNRIPYFNILKLREVVNFKGFWGHLSSRNNPSKNQNLYLFPSDAIATIPGNTPYMELSVGIDNIFSVVRLDYVWRLSYRHTPGAPDSGLRIALHFSF